MQCNFKPLFTENITRPATEAKLDFKKNKEFNSVNVGWKIASEIGYKNHLLMSIQYFWILIKYIQCNKALG